MGGGQRRSPTHSSWLMSGGIASAIFFFFSDEIRGNPQAAQGRPHILLLSFFFFLLLYSIILSDRPSPLSADSRASFQLASGKGGPLVCRHAGGNWIIPEIWASAQMESVIKAERRSNIDTDESCDVEIQSVSQQNKIFSSPKIWCAKGTYDAFVMKF